MDRIRDKLNATRPALVIVEIGGNDFLRRRPEAAVKEDLRAIIAAIRQSGAQVVLVAVPRLSLIGVATGKLPSIGGLSETLATADATTELPSAERLATEVIEPAPDRKV